MRFTKTKTTIIALFLLANFAAIYFYIIDGKESAQLRGEVILQCEALLAAKSITVSAKKFPKLPASLPVYIETNALPSKEDIAAKILGADFVMAQPNLFQNSSYNLFINGDKFELFDASLTSDSIAELKTPRSFFAALTAKADLKRLKISSPTARIADISDSAELKKQVTFHDYLNGYPVVNSQIIVGLGLSNASISGSKYIITKVSAINWRLSTYAQVPGQVRTTLPLAALLEAFAQAQSAPLVLERVTFGYYISSHENDSRPTETALALRFYTSLGDFYMDASTGELL